MKPSLILASSFGAVILGFAVGWMVAPAGASAGKTEISGPAINPSSTGEDSSASLPPKKEASDKDFAARLDHIASLANPYKRARAIAGIADDLNEMQVREALATLENKNVVGRDEIRLQLLERWAELEPENALQYALKLPTGSLAPRALNIVIATWAAMDARAAEAGVERMTASFAKQIAWGALAEVISDSDPKRAFTLMRRGYPTGDAIKALFERWTQKDPYEAAAHVAQLPPPYVRALALRTLSRKFAETDRERALEWAQALPASVASGASIGFRDPTPLATVLETWMNEDASAALKWLGQLDDGFAKTDVLTMLSRSLAEEEPDQALEVATLMPEGKARDSALNKMIDSWGQKDLNGALMWAQQLQEAHVRQKLLSRLAGQLAGRDIPAALELATSIGDQPGEQAVKRVLDTWVGKEPAAAAAWAAEQPDNQNYLSTVAFTWAGRDEKAAREWAQSLSPGAIKNEVLLSGVNHLAQSIEPLKAEPWIVAMSDPVKQAAAYRALGYWWLRSNPKDARAWISTAPLSAEMKEAFLNSK